MQVEGLQFGAGVQGREGRGPVDGLLFGGGDDEVGRGVRDGADGGVVEGPGVEELGGRLGVLVFGKFLGLGRRGRTGMQGGMN